jgi:hypothetical protein
MLETQRLTDKQENFTQAIFAEAEINLFQSRELKQMAPANGSLQMIGKVTGILVDKVEHSGEISHAHNVIHGLSDDMLDRLAGLVTPEFGDTVPETRGIIEHEPTNVSPEEV